MKLTERSAQNDEARKNCHHSARSRARRYRITRVGEDLE
jgi:hypothetical protein